MATDERRLTQIDTDKCRVCFFADRRKNGPRMNTDNTDELRGMVLTAEDARKILRSFGGLRNRGEGQSDGITFWIGGALLWEL